MGILTFGVFSGFRKRTGPLVGRTVNHKNVVSMVGHASSVPASSGQLEQQLMFKLVVLLLARFKNLIAIGFTYKGVRSAFNAAVKYNFQHVVLGNFPDYHIDYARVMYSRGKLAGPSCPSVSAGTAGNLRFSWLAGEQNRFSRYTDKATFLVYSPSRKLAATAIGKATRSDLVYEMVLPSGFSDAELHCYMGFVSADGKEVSNSVYLGVI